MRCYDSHINSVVCVSCGKQRGTAFFVNNKQLLTARHTVVEHLRNQRISITIFYQGHPYLCSAQEPEGEYRRTDIVLLSILDDTICADFYSLLSIPKPLDQSLWILGYPAVIGGCKNIFEIELIQHRLISGREYNYIGAPRDTFSLRDFHGFSGAPVLTEVGSVIGIVTDQLGETLGYLSLASIEQLLLSWGLIVETNYAKEDFSLYGYGTSRTFVDNQIKKAGNRYTPKLHQENVGLHTFLDNFCDLSLSSKYEEYKKNIDDYILSFGISHPDIYGVISSGEITLYGIEFYLREKKEERWYKLAYRELNKNFHYYEQILDYKRKTGCKCMLIQAEAGSGKTHLMCNYADVEDENRMTYLFFGNQFDAAQTIEQQICHMLSFGASGLKGLEDALSHEDRCGLLIIDAINEGPDSSFWKVSLEQLGDELLKYNHIKLVVTVRKPVQEDFVGREWARYYLSGFENPKKAVDKYFHEYKIDYDVTKNINDFKNPLYLKIFCEAYKCMSSIERDNINRINSLLYYLRARNETVSKLVDEDPLRNVTTDYLLKVAESSIYDYSLGHIERWKARELGDELCPGRFWSKSLLHVCLMENLLMDGAFERLGYKIVGFDYEQLGDYLKAAVLLKKEETAEHIIKQLVWLDASDTRYHSMINRSLGQLIGALIDILPKDSDVMNHEELKTGRLVKYLDFALPLHTNFNHEIIRRLISSKSIPSLDFLISGFSSFSLREVDALDNFLQSMTMAQRDAVWTSKVNKLFDNEGIEALLFEGVLENNHSLIPVYVGMMSWMLSSSYPVVRATIIRRLVDLLCMGNALQDEILNSLSKYLSDPYIISGLTCALYGYVLTCMDTVEVHDIANKIYLQFYKNKRDVPNDVHIRQWTLKILEKDRWLMGKESFYDEVLHRSFQNHPLPIFKNLTIENKDYFGKDHGSQKIYNSLFTWDFNRYVIGTNHAHENKTFRDQSTGQSVGLDHITYWVAYCIKQKLGWNTELGIIDDDSSDWNWEHNYRERIGKKYQWIALYDVIGRMMDLYEMHYDEFSVHNGDVCPNLPWNTGYASRFDPTLHRIIIPKLSLQADYINSIDERDAYDWIADMKTLPHLNVLYHDDAGKPWMALYAYDTIKDKKDGIIKEYFLFYNSMFVHRKDMGRFTAWAKKINFYGRWLPESSGNYEFLWNEYPWADNYQQRDMSVWINDDKDLPCGVLLSYVEQLQEDSIGVNADKNICSPAYMPCVDIMQKCRLYTAERGVIRRIDNNEIVAINLDLLNDGENGGLLIRCDVLDNYMLAENLVLYHCVLGEKNAYMEKDYDNLNIRYDLSGCLRYVGNGNLQDVQALNVSKR